MATTKQTAGTAPAKKAPTKSVTAHRKMGAPTKYSVELADKICAMLMQGKSLNKICPELGINITTVWDWLNKYQDFSTKYVRAREAQADLLAEEIVSIADELEIEAKHQGETVTFDVSATAVQRNRLRVDARKWYASKLAPKKYADKLETTLSGPDGGAVQHSVIVKFV